MKAYIQTPRLVERKNQQTGELELVRDGNMSGSWEEFLTTEEFLATFPINPKYYKGHDAVIAENLDGRSGILHKE